MSWMDLVSLLIVVGGLTLFVYGANSYNVVVGWVGVIFVFSGLLLKAVLSVLQILRRKT